MRNIHDKNHDVAMTKTIETCQSQFSHETMLADEKCISSQPSRASQSRRNIATATTTMLESYSLSMTIDFIQCPDGLSLRGRLSPDATADTRRGLDEHGEIVESMRIIRLAAIASNAVAMSATDGEVRIRAHRLPGLRHPRAAVAVAEKLALDRFCNLGRRANAIRGSAHMRLRSRVTLADLLQLWMQRKDSEISCARLSIVSIAGTNEIQRQPVLTIAAELFSRRSNNVAVSRRSFQLEIPAHLNALNNAADAYHFRGARSAVLPTCPITRIRRRCVDENIRSVSDRPDKRAGQRQAP